MICSRKFFFSLSLVVALLFTVFLSLISCTNSFAASSFSWRDASFSINNPSEGWMPATSVGSYFAVNHGFETSGIRWIGRGGTGSPTFYPSTGDYITIAGSFVTLFDYSSSGINEPPEISCPLFNIDGMLTAVDCNMSVSSDISSGQHFTVYNWIYTGQFASNYSSSGVSVLSANFYLKNNTQNAIRIYVSGLSIGVGSSLEQVNINAIRSFNNDFTSLMTTLFNNIASQTTTLETAIQYFNRDYISYTQDLIAALGDLDTSSIAQAQDELNDKIDEQQRQEQQDRDNIQQQSDDVASDGDDAQASVDNASGNLMTIIGNFFNVLQHPSSQNCNINGDMGHMNLGNINLCQLSVPPAVSAIATVLMIGVIIPVVISIINTFAELLWRFFV